MLLQAWLVCWEQEAVSFYLLKVWNKYGFYNRMVQWSQISRCIPGLFGHLYLGDTGVFFCYGLEMFAQQNGCIRMSGGTILYNQEKINSISGFTQLAMKIK